MAKDELSFEDFTLNVNPMILGFVNDIHDYMINNGCVCKITPAANSPVLSYTLMKTKRVIANYVFRKNGLIIRIYGDNISKYGEVFNTMPKGMITAVEKAPVCKRLVDPTKCNPKCGMGYVFELNKTVHQKCRYSSFMFEVKDENYAAIRDFLVHELSERSA